MIFPRQIIAAVASANAMTVDALLARTHKHSVAHIRQEAMFLVRELTGASLPRIGRAFGRDHATVFHALAVVTERLRDDAALGERLDAARVAILRSNIQ